MCPHYFTILVVQQKMQLIVSSITVIKYTTIILSLFTSLCNAPIYVETKSMKSAMLIRCQFNIELIPTWMLIRCGLDVH